MKPFLVLCLGNEVLSDDAFGPVVAERLNSHPLGNSQTEVTFAPVAGFKLLELLRDRQAVLIVDAIRTEVAEPGTLHFFSAGIFTPSYSLTTSHQISLPTAIEFGRRLGYNMPEDIQVLACEAGDVETLSETLTPEVAQAVEPALAQIKEWISRKQTALIDRVPA